MLFKVAAKPETCNALGYETNIELTSISRNYVPFVILRLILCTNKPAGILRSFLIFPSGAKLTKEEEKVQLKRLALLNSFGRPLSMISVSWRKRYEASDF